MFLLRPSPIKWGGVSIKFQTLVWFKYRDLGILLFVLSVSDQAVEKLMPTFLFHIICMSVFFLIPKMSSSVSKGISHRIFNIIVIDVKRDRGININIL